MLCVKEELNNIELSKEIQKFLYVLGRSLAVYLIFVKEGADQGLFRPGVWDQFPEEASAPHDL